MSENAYIDYIESILDIRLRNKLNKFDDSELSTYSKKVIGDKWYNAGKVISETECKETISMKIDKLRKIAEEYINIKTRKEQTFISLWEYCEFIRWCEKLFLYKNNDNNLIYCDSEMKSLDSRIFVIFQDDYNIYFKLQMSKTIDIKANKSLDFHKVIDIVVERKFGKEMKNKFTIVDGEFKYNDDSDIYLMEEINIILNESIREVYLMILDNLCKEDFLEGEIYE